MTAASSAYPQRAARAARRAAAIAFGLALLLAACTPDDDRAATPASPTPPTSGVAPATPLSADRQVTVNGTDRTYRLVTPPGDAAVPVIVAIHDAGNTIDGMMEVTQLHREAVRGGFAVAFPAAAQAAERTWNAGFCCGAGPSVGLDDMGFLDAVIDELAAHERIDADRVYLAGVSNGAVMAYQYACERPERIAGVGSVAGTMNPEGCEPAEPVSVLEIHGTADEVVPFDGGEMPEFVQATRPAMSAPALVRHWAEVGACAGEPTTATDPPVTRTVWEECEAAAGVGLVAVEGAGHTWYASEFGPVEGAVDATTEILRFFGLDG